MEAQIDTKICNKCKESKPIGSYSGKSPTCKPCIHEIFSPQWGKPKKPRIKKPAKVNDSILSKHPLKW